MNATVTPIAQLPYDLKLYIKQKQNDTSSTNQADNKSTSQSEYDEIASRSIRLYAFGQEFMKTLENKDTLPRCRRLYELDHLYGGNDLVEARILGNWMIVPRYVTLIERIRKLRDAII